MSKKDIKKSIESDAVVAEDVVANEAASDSKVEDLKEIEASVEAEISDGSEKINVNKFSSEELASQYIARPVVQEKPVKAKKTKMSLATRRAITGYLFIMPWLVGFCLYYVRSLMMTIQFSFSDVSVTAANASSSGRGYETKFVWFDNFKHIFAVDTKFNQHLLVSVEDIMIDVPLILTFALLMAILLNQKFFGRTAFRAIFFIPVIMSCDAISGAIQEARMAAIGGISSTSATIAEANSSSINLDYYVSLFKDIGLPAGIIDYVVAAVGRIAEVVDLAGVQIVIFIAALQSIPTSLYEVAKIEGATTYETFWKVTFPMVMPHIITCLVYTVVDAFADSEVVEYSYETIFTNGLDYDYGSAMSLVSMLVVCILLFIVVALIQRKTFYYN